MATTKPRQRKTTGRVMHEFKHGELKSGRGGKGDSPMPRAVKPVLPRCRLRSVSSGGSEFIGENRGGAWVRLRKGVSS